jgi:hyperosmotically inducible protein
MVAASTHTLFSTTLAGNGFRLNFYRPKAFVMNRAWFSRQFLASVLALSCLALPSCRMRESDGDILTEISNRMHADPAMEGINAAVANGVVTLTGTCPDEPCRQHATEALTDIKGVQQVVNHITLATSRKP